MRNSVILLLILLTTAPLFAQEIDASVRRKKILKVPLVRQESQMWCWAASTQMILSYFGNAVTQCQQVSAVLPNDDCCTLISKKGPLTKKEKKSRRKCKRQGHWPMFDKLGFTAKATDSTKALTWDQLKHEIDNNRPVAFAWNWRGGGSHMMVVRGYADPHWVYINDPWPPRGDFTKATGEHRIITYKEYVSGSEHSHSRDFYNIRARAGRRKVSQK